MPASPNYMAGETLYPSRFAKGSTTEDHTALMGTDAAKLIGVIHEGSRTAPIPEVSTVEAAQDGEEVRIHGPGEECWVEIGAAVTADDLLASDANGRAVPAAAGEYYGARALSAGGASGQRIRCRVELGQLNA